MFSSLCATAIHSTLPRIRRRALGKRLTRAWPVHTDGTLYVVGTAECTDFPVTGGGFQPARGRSDEAFVLKLTLDDAPPQEPASEVYLSFVQNGR
jgi:hypothetical protein